MSDEDYKAEGEAINPPEEEVTVDTSDEQGATDGEQENTEALKETLAKLEEEKRHLLARAKKAEAQTKGKRTDLTTPDVPSSESVDERILKANGMPDELVKELKRVARFSETDLISAQKDPMFLAIKEKFEKEQRDKEASLGASKGSGAGKPRKDFTTPDLTAEDHKKLWQRQMGR
jgi:hypothetical protein